MSPPPDRPLWVRTLRFTLLTSVASEVLCVGLYMLIGHDGPWWIYALPAIAPLVLAPPPVYVLVRAQQEAAALHVELAERNCELEREVSERKRLEHTLRRVANEDPLTSALNRRGFDEVAAGEFAAARRHGRDLSLVLMDMDGFKQLNDRFGHAIGDEALRVFATAIHERIRRGDHLARLGGDEFAILAREVDASGVRCLARQVRALVGSLQIIADERRVALSVSVGVATLRASDASMEALLARADAELYSRKGTRRASHPGGAA